MPNAQTHIRQAEANQSVINDLDQGNPAHRQWAAVCAFYAALHWVEAIFATQNIDNASHEARAIAINEAGRADPLFSRIEISYEQLKSFSMGARYYCRSMSTHKLTREVLPFLGQIEQEARERLKHAGHLL